MHTHKSTVKLGKPAAIDERLKENCWASLIQVLTPHCTNHHAKQYPLQVDYAAFVIGLPHSPHRVARDPVTPPRIQSQGSVSASSFSSFSSPKTHPFHIKFESNLRPAIPYVRFAATFSSLHHKKDIFPFNSTNKPCKQRPQMRIR